MKKFVFAGLMVAAAAATAGARPVDLALWTFEVSQPATAGPHLAEGGVYQSISNAIGFHAGTTTYSSPVGNGSARSFSSSNWLVGDYYEFRTSSTNYMTLSITWDQTSSNTGPRDFNLQVSVNGGMTYSTIMSYMVLANASPNTPWSSTGPRNPAYTFTASLPLSAEDLADLRIRFTQSSTVSAAGGTVASGGTSRVDNVQISGELIPTPGTLALAVAAGLLVSRRRRG